MASFLRKQSAYQMFINVRYQIESQHIGVPLWYEAACVHQPRQKLAPVNTKAVKVLELEGRLLRKLARRYPEMTAIA